ncbi:hypothetical protein ACWENQ_45675 [Nonomuraea sp. NPDC004354]
MGKAAERLIAVADQRKRVKAQLAEVETRHKTAVLEALDSGLSTRRVRELGDVSLDTINRWKNEKKAAQEQADTERGQA